MNNNSIGLINKLITQIDLISDRDSPDFDYVFDSMDLSFPLRGLDELGRRLCSPSFNGPFIQLSTLDSSLTFAGLADSLAREKHINFIINLAEKEDKVISGDELGTLEYHASSHMKMSGIYWSISAMYLLGSIDKMDKNKIIKWVMSCQHPNGGFGGSSTDDANLIYTLSAIQILAIFKSLNLLDANKVAKYISSLQLTDGSFKGDEWGEIDTRFSYCALCSLAILKKSHFINITKATNYISSCKNFDGAFGAVPSAESHAGQIFCCLGGLAIGDALYNVDSELLGGWLCDRQLPCGGLNGRPEKKEDVCYSWWVLSSLAILNKVSWINKRKLVEFILSAQDFQRGAIADRADNVADVYHLFFGLAGLSLLRFPNLLPIDPVFALPCDIVKYLELPVMYSVS